MYNVLFAKSLAEEISKDLVLNNPSFMLDENELFLSLTESFVNHEISEFSDSGLIADITNKTITGMIESHMTETILNLTDKGLIKTHINPDGELVYSINLNDND